jgi:hypothetical protein
VGGYHQEDTVISKKKWVEDESGEDGHGSLSCLYSFVRFLSASGQIGKWICFSLNLEAKKKPRRGRGFFAAL